MQNYPTSLDNGTSLPTPSATDNTESPSLSGLNGSQNNAIIALETKLGITACTPTAGMLLRSTADGESTWDLPYPASETFVGLTDTQTLTNKTIDASNNTITNLTGADLASQSITATQIANATITATQIANNTITATQIANNTITATQIANATITASNLAANSITGTNGISGNGALGGGSVAYAALASNIFSGQFGTYGNNGTGGGTFYYGNIGGLKIITGQSDGSSSSTTTLNYPPGFFTTWAIATYSLAGVTTTPTGTILWTNGSNSTAAVTVNITGQPSGLVYTLSFLVVGV